MTLSEHGTRDICISVVSHRHGEELFRLAQKLESLCATSVGQIILTLNVPEPDLFAKINSRQWSFEVIVVQNDEPKGFGANHNAAFEFASRKYFCVLNPDIDLSTDPFPDLINKCQDPLAGCVFPRQLGTDGKIQDYARQLPSPGALLSRYLGVRAGATECEHPVWVNGAFMLYPARVFKLLGGFDQRYFMYCEDVDICLRLQLAGFKLSQSTATVVHAAQRNTRANLRHLVWHVTSLVRLWSSPAYKKFYLRQSV